MLSSYHSKSETTKAYIQMHLSIILWGLTGVLGRGIELSEGMLVWYRMLITAASMLLFILFTKKSFAVSKADFMKLLGIGFIITIHWLCFYGAIKYSNISITLSMLASQGLFTALMEPLVTGKKIHKEELFFSVLAMVGIWLIFSVEKIYVTGIVLALLASFLGAFFNIFNKSMVNRIEPVVVSFYEILTGVAMLTVFLPFYIGYFHPAKLIPNTNDWILLFVLAVFCTHLTLMLSLSALKYLSAFTLNLSINLEPVYGIALAFLIFHENEHLHWGFFVGGAIIMLSVLLHGFYASKQGIKENEPTQ